MKAATAKARAVLLWAVIGCAVLIPLAIAAVSPQLQWRDPVYIVAGFAGVVALALLLVQPLLAGGYLAGLPPRKGRKVHQWIGAGLVLAVLVHVIGLWITSPPDVLDVLLFRSPTPFAIWGNIAMWAVFAAALLALLRSRNRLSPVVWRVGHTALAVTIVIGTIVHAVLIEGTMGTISKAVLCALALTATIKVIFDLKAWLLLSRRRA